MRLDDLFIAKRGRLVLPNGRNLLLQTLPPLDLLKRYSLINLS